MAVHNFEDLRKHHKHEIAVMVYGDDEEESNVAIECFDCNEVLLDFDKDEKADEPEA